MRTALIKTCNYGYTKHVEWPDGKQVFTNYKGGNEMGWGGRFSAKLNSGRYFPTDNRGPFIPQMGRPFYM